MHLTHEAPLDRQLNGGRDTPLTWTIKRNGQNVNAIFRFLLQAGADPLLADELGFSAQKLAAQMPNPSFRYLLDKASANGVN